MIRWHYFVSYTIPVRGGWCAGQATIDCRYRLFKDHMPACEQRAQSVEGATAERVVFQCTRLIGLQIGAWKFIWG